jgi:photosystem II stability/assembly factor-like uncharacterized protein
MAIIRSSDGGVTWDDLVTLNNPPDRNLNAVTTSGNTVVAVGDKDGPTVSIYRSLNGGSTWDLPNSFPSGAPNNRPLTDMVFVSPTTVLAVGEEKSGSVGYRILISADTGNNWTEPTLPAGSENLNAVTYKSGLALAVGENGAILASTDGGNTWTQDNSGSAADLLDVAIINPSIVVGSGGEVLVRQSTAAAASGSVLQGGTVSLGEEPVDVPFEHEWVFALLVLAYALQRLRGGGLS